ncbi:transcriptional regulator swi6 [Phlyctochytrium bullatum]|nr:transcriptional regulator swi6 [Phlyctochytrium bullatum]
MALRNAQARSKTDSKEPTGLVYGAIYSGIPVYEMMCRNIAMMRRRSDSYLNATQILKAAGIEKGRRTKILDKEIVTGLHEKIQGGYGKYQGTWIPYERGVALAKQFEIYELIKPLLEMESVLPGKQDKTPTKEQHLAALKSAGKAELKANQKDGTTARSKAQASAAAADDQGASHGMTRRAKRPLTEKGKESHRGSRSDSPSSASTPSDDDDEDYMSSSNEKNLLPHRKKAKVHDDSVHTGTIASTKNDSQEERHALLKQLLDVQDCNGDTALSIAARMGNRAVVERLLEAGADESIPNLAGLYPSDFGGMDDLWKNVRFPMIRKMVDSLNGTFADSLRKKHTRLQEAQLQLRDMSKELSELRRENEALRTEAKAIPELARRLRHLYRRFQATTNSPLVNVMRKWAQASSDDQKEDISDIKDKDDLEILMDAADISDVKAALTSGDAGVITKKKSELKGMLEFVNNWARLYQQDISRLDETLERLSGRPSSGDTEKDDAMEVDITKANGTNAVDSRHLAGIAKKEALCRRIVAEVCKLPLESVDRTLEMLLEALEQDGSLPSSLSIEGIDLANLRTSLGSIFAASSS